MLTLRTTGKLMLCCLNQLLQTVQNVDHQNQLKRKKRQRSSKLQSNIQLICGLRITFHTHTISRCVIFNLTKDTLMNAEKNRRKRHQPAAVVSRNAQKSPHKSLNRRRQ